MCGGRGSRAPVHAVKSGTESFNCPDSEILCDLSHVNVGGVVFNEVTCVTKMMYKKNSTQVKEPKTT